VGLRGNGRKKIGGEPRRKRNENLNCYEHGVRLWPWTSEKTREFDPKWGPGGGKKMGILPFQPARREALRKKFVVRWCRL